MPATTSLTDGTVDVSTSLGVAALLGLFLTVTLGAIVPIVPTGAAVSGVAAFAWHHEHWC